MKFLKKLKSSNFWVSMISAVVLILQAVFNVDIKTEYLNQIIMAILGLLVMSGIVTDSNNDEVTVKQNIDTDSVKASITSMLSQVSTTIETTMLGIVEQFELIKNNIDADIVKKEQFVKEEVVEMIEEKAENIEKDVESKTNFEPIETVNEVEMASIENVKVDEQNSL